MTCVERWYPTRGTVARETLHHDEEIPSLTRHLPILALQFLRGLLFYYYEIFAQSVCLIKALYQNLHCGASED